MIWVSPFDTEFKIHFSVSLLFFEGGLLGRNGKKTSFHLFPNSMKAKKTYVRLPWIKPFSICKPPNPQLLGWAGEGILWCRKKAAWPWPHCWEKCLTCVAMPHTLVSWLGNFSWAKRFCFTWWVCLAVGVSPIPSFLGPRADFFRGILLVSFREGKKSMAGQEQTP